jgi:hypothetical protein
MIDYKIEKIEFLPKNKLDKGVFIWVLHVNKIPPHIGISVKGLFYSLKVNSRDYRVKADKILNIIQNKNIACLFVELDKFNGFNIDLIFKELSSINKEYPSCLTPISQALCGGNHKQIGRLTELLVILYKNQRIKSFFKLNLESDFEGIKFYTKKDIQQRISELKDAKRRKHLPQGN